MELGLKGRTVFVVGAASGIGLATARMFAQEGSSLLLWDISPEIEKVGSQLTQEFQVDVQTQIVDIADSEVALSQWTQFANEGRTIDHSVHCAAIGSGKFGFPFTNLRPSDWLRTLEVNILGMVNLAHIVAPHFIERRAGTFVFLSSVAGQNGSQTDPPYSASKAANINFAQCMAKDLAEYGIRVNTVCPSMVETALNRSVWQAWYERTPNSERLSYEDWATKKIKTVVPLQRWQSADDIAAMIVFLSSDRASQVTGQTINVDGGTVMHW